MRKKRNNQPKRRQAGNTKSRPPVTFIDELADQVEIDEQTALLRQASEESLLESRGLVRLYIPKDGACLFRAVSQALYHTQELHSVVREQAGATIEKFSDHFTPFIPEEHLPLTKYLGMIAHPAAWGGHLELSALSLYHSLSFRIYSAEPTAEPTTAEPSSYAAAARSTDTTPKKPDLQLFDMSMSLSPPNLAEELQYDREVALFFSNGNHYDLLYSREQHDRLAFCQSIVYDLLARAVGNTSATTADSHRYVNVGLEQWTRRQEREERESTELARCMAAAFISSATSSSSSLSAAGGDKLSDWIAVRGGRRYHISQEEQDAAEQKRLEEEALRRHREQEAARERVTQALTSDNPSVLFPALPKKSKGGDVLLPALPVLPPQTATPAEPSPDATTPAEEATTSAATVPAAEETDSPAPAPAATPAKPFSWAAVAEKAPVLVVVPPKAPAPVQDAAPAAGASRGGWTESYRQKPKSNRGRDESQSQRGDRGGSRGSSHSGGGRGGADQRRGGDRGSAREDRDRRGSGRGGQSDRRGRGDQDRRRGDQSSSSRGRGRS